MYFNFKIVICKLIVFTVPLKTPQEFHTLAVNSKLSLP